MRLEVGSFLAQLLLGYIQLEVGSFLAQLPCCIYASDWRGVGWGLRCDP